MTTLEECISTDDFVTVSNFFGAYCWRIDECDEEGWLSLWAEDGVFAGMFPEPLVGHDQLRIIVQKSAADNPGMMRHVAANLHCRYGETRDIVHARLYNFVTNWAQEDRFVVMAVCNATLVRDGTSWKMKRNDVKPIR